MIVLLQLLDSITLSSSLIGSIYPQVYEQQYLRMLILRKTKANNQWPRIIDCINFTFIVTFNLIILWSMMFLVVEQ